LALKVNVGVIRKVGQPDYGSVGASCNLELEIESGLLDRDLDGFHARVRSAYVAVHQAVHDELARLQAPVAALQDPPASPIRHGSNGHGSNGHSANGHTSGNGHTGHQPTGRSRTRKPATENQVRAIRSIASRQHADLDALLRDLGVQRPEDLSLRQASDLIDTLKTAATI
jgi:hypothetical protein